MLLMELGGADDGRQIDLLTLVHALLVERGLGKEVICLCKVFINVFT
jgi:hypothetical protein